MVILMQHTCLALCMPIVCSAPLNGQVDCGNGLVNVGHEGENCDFSCDSGYMLQENVILVELVKTLEIGVLEVGLVLKECHFLEVGVDCHLVYLSTVVRMIYQYQLMLNGEIYEHCSIA